MEQLFFDYSKLRTRASLILILATLILTNGWLAGQSLRPLAAAAAGALSTHEDKVEKGTSSIYGIVWVDFNHNGQQEQQEPAVFGQTIFVTPAIDSDFAQILVLYTNEYGEFSATNLAPGAYRVWASTQDEDSAQVVHVTTDRAVMTVQVPLVGFTLFMPQVVR